MEIADQREVFGPSYEEFHSDKIVRIEGESVLSFRDGDQSLPSLLNKNTLRPSTMTEVLSRSRG